MPGTIVCGVADNEEGRTALELAAELSERLRLRLVVVHVVDEIASLAGKRGRTESASDSRERAARLVARLADEHGVGDRAEQRSAVGDPATLLGQIAAEEAADLIVVGAKPKGWLRRRLESTLAHQLETETPIPVVIAPPLTRRRRSATINGVRR